MMTTTTVTYQHSTWNQNFAMESPRGSKGWTDPFTLGAMPFHAVVGSTATTTTANININTSMALKNDATP